MGIRCAKVALKVKRDVAADTEDMRYVCLRRNRVMVGSDPVCGFILQARSGAVLLNLGMGARHRFSWQLMQLVRQVQQKMEAADGTAAISPQELWNISAMATYYSSKRGLWGNRSLCF